MALAPDCYRVPLRPRDVPGLIAFWDFQEDGGPRCAVEGEPYVLVEGAGTVPRVAASGNPWGPWAAQIAEGAWLVCPRRSCPGLDRHGMGQGVTVVAWLHRDRVRKRHCEFIAGQWNETNRGRQYGLFLDIGVWGEHDQVTAHVSSTGGPTPGYRYCIDAATGATPVPHGAWSCVAMTYDGWHAAAWLDGLLDARPGVNPYALAGGLHDGGAAGSDFTVGAVDRSGEMGNCFAGLLGGLAVWSRALSAAELRALARPG